VTTSHSKCSRCGNLNAFVRFSAHRQTAVSHFARSGVFPACTSRPLDYTYHNPNAPSSRMEHIPPDLLLSHSRPRPLTRPTPCPSTPLHTPSLHLPARHVPKEPLDAKELRSHTSNAPTQKCTPNAHPARSVRSPTAHHHHHNTVSDTEPLEVDWGSI
jgi:hypothetical protein